MSDDRKTQDRIGDFEQSAWMWGFYALGGFTSWLTDLHVLVVLLGAGAAAHFLIKANRLRDKKG